MSRTLVQPVQNSHTTGNPHAEHAFRKALITVQKVLPFLYRHMLAYGALTVKPTIIIHHSTYTPVAAAGFQTLFLVMLLLFPVVHPF